MVIFSQKFCNTDGELAGIIYSIIVHKYALLCHALWRINVEKCGNKCGSSCSLRRCHTDFLIYAIKVSSSIRKPAAASASSVATNSLSRSHSLFPHCAGTAMAHWMERWYVNIKWGLECLIYIRWVCSPKRSRLSLTNLNLCDNEWGIFSLCGIRVVMREGTFRLFERHPRCCFTTPHSSSASARATGKVLPHPAIAGRILASRACRRKSASQKTDKYETKGISYGMIASTASQNFFTGSTGGCLLAYWIYFAQHIRTHLCVACQTRALLKYEIAKIRNVIAHAERLQWVQISTSLLTY